MGKLIEVTVLLTGRKILINPLCYEWIEAADGKCIICPIDKSPTFETKLEESYKEIKNKLCTIIL